MASNIKPQMVKQVSQSITTTTTSSAFSIEMCDAYSICVVVTGVLNTSPTLDIVLQHSVDKGATYTNLPIRTAQITAVGNLYFTFRRGIGQAEAAFNQTNVADTGGALAKNVVFDPTYMKIKATVGGSGAGAMTFTYNVTGVARSDT